MNTDLHKQPRALEKGFVIIALLFFADAIVPIVNEIYGIKLIFGESDRIALVISSLIYIITFFLIISYTKDILTLIKREKFIACLVGIAILSTLWSDLPDITFRRGIVLFGTTLFGLYLAVRYTLKEQLRLLAIMLGIAATLSLLFAIFLPSYGITGEIYEITPQGIRIASEIYEGTWKGIFFHKNVLGRLMVLSVLVFAMLNIEETKYRIIKWAMLGLSLSLLILSESKSSLVIFGIILILFTFYKSLQWHINIRLSLYCFYAIAVIFMVVWSLGNTKYIFNIVDRDITLSGRSDLWEAVLIMIRKRPFLGYGYNAFWLGLKGKSAVLWKLVGWQATHSHNGLLDLWLDLGIFGVVLFILAFFQAFCNAIRKIGSADSMEVFWPLFYLTFMLLFNLTESSILQQNSIFWVLFVATSSCFYSKLWNTSS
jgi:exopolysaccharide production protein ExoQ